MVNFSDSAIISRIAPTPSGYLHAGNAFSFVLSWLLVRNLNGKLLLRIDDSDTTRSRPEFIEDVFYTLDWLGLDYDIGPQGPDDFMRNFSQKHRMDLYRSVLEELREKTGLVYACSCSRKQIQEQSQTGLYAGSCREKGLSFANKKAAWRIQVPEEKEICYSELLGGKIGKVFPGKEMGDFVICRKDGLPAYQVASLADDMHYSVNLLVRGSDLRQSTGAQLYLAEQLSQIKTKWSNQAADFRKARFLHHPLLTDAAGDKLSKSRGASSIADIRASGKGPHGIYKLVASFLGLPCSDICTIEELLDTFDLSLLQRRMDE